MNWRMRSAETRLVETLGDAPHHCFVLGCGGRSVHGGVVECLRCRRCSLGEKFRYGARVGTAMRRNSQCLAQVTSFLALLVSSRAVFSATKWGWARRR